MHALITIAFAAVGAFGLCVVAWSLRGRMPAQPDLWLTTPPTEAQRQMRLQRALHLIRQYEKGKCPFCGQKPL